MAEKIVVSGVGIYTCLGKGIEKNFKALKQEKHALTSLDFLETIHAKEFPFGEIKKSTADIAHSVSNHWENGFTRTSILGIAAIQEAYESAKIPLKNKLRIGLINSSTVGSMCEIEKYYDDLIEQKPNSSILKDTIDCADCSHRIADYFDIKHFVTTISTACSSSANAIMLGTRLINQGKIDIAICGGTDALTRFTINGFNSLKNIDKNFCSPFDANRNGLNLGEGAAYLVLEKVSNCVERNATPMATLSGYCNFNEAFHPTAPNPAGLGSYEVMKRALAKANLTTKDINYINAHGTATLTNDESESNAMLKLFENNVPTFSSTKCYTGHTLAAAGAVEAIFSILALQNNCVYGNLNFKNPMPESQLIPQLHFEENKEMNHVMSNSYAFGGNNASLIFSKYIKS